MYTVIQGVTRDQMMARHKTNYLNVAYTPSAEKADQELAAKAAFLHDLGTEVHLCGISI